MRQSHDGVGPFTTCVMRHKRDTRHGPRVKELILLADLSSREDYPHRGVLSFEIIQVAPGGIGFVHCSRTEDVPCHS